MHRKTIIDFKELNKRYLFTRPIQELKTHQLTEIGSILEQVESYQKQGYYVVGYLSYEAAPYFEQKMATHSHPLAGEYLAYFTVHKDCEMTDFPLNYIEVDMPEKWQSLTNDKNYQKAIETIHQQIRQGNTYQVNHTIRLKQNLSYDSLAIYNRLVVEQEAAYNAYIQHDDVTVLSISPELFFHQKGDKLTTRPMKGTISRGVTLEDDLARKDWLAQDVKNRAENMMIVDLLRNDMGRICQIGSVHVSQLCQVEQYSTVWQMTSTIEGQLESKTSLHQIFEALFPCGSITGAPKLSTMDIIKQLEEQPRGVYCGTIGICFPYQDCIFNVAIRSIQLYQTEAYYGVGGGITWDSQWQDELAETKAKSAILYRKRPRFELITTGKIQGRKLTFHKEHLTRLKESSRYFAYPFDQALLSRQLEKLYQTLNPSQDYRLKISLSKSGTFTLDCQELTALSREFRQARICLQEKTLDTPFTYFKTSHRPHISLGKQETIYHDQNGFLLETSIGNLILEKNGKLLTPPTHLGILNGIYRQHLIKTGQLSEALLTLEDLETADKVYACNAVRGMYELEQNTI